MPWYILNTIDTYILFIILQPSIASLYGDCTVTLNLVVHNKQEKLVLSGSSTNISIYQKGNFV